MAKQPSAAELQHNYEGVKYDFIFPVDSLEKCKNMEFDESDVMVVGYPKTGTTWMTEMTWLTMNNVDTEAAAKTKLMERVPLIELKAPGMPVGFVDIISKRPHPRTMTTHLNSKLMSKAIEKGKPKVIVIMRNPKDSLVSYYHFYNTRAMFDKIPTFSEFFEIFKKNELVFGDWFDHVLGWWNDHRDDKNFMFINYEDIKADHYGSLEKVVKFLGKDLSPEQIQKIVDFTSFSTMKTKTQSKMGADDSFIKETKGAFIRKGIVGDWKNVFTEGESKFVDDLIEKRLTGTGINFEC